MNEINKMRYKKAIEQIVTDRKDYNDLILEEVEKITLLFMQKGHEKDIVLDSFIAEKLFNIKDLNKVQDISCAAEVTETLRTELIEACRIDISEDIDEQLEKKIEETLIDNVFNFQKEYWNARLTGPTYEIFGGVK